MHESGQSAASCLSAIETMLPNVWCSSQAFSDAVVSRTHVWQPYY